MDAHGLEPARGSQHSRSPLGELPMGKIPMGKIGAGLLHGLFSSITGSIWCILAGTLFCWVPRRTLRPDSRTESS